MWMVGTVISVALVFVLIYFMDNFSLRNFPSLNEREKRDLHIIFHKNSLI